MLLAEKPYFHKFVLYRKAFKRPRIDNLEQKKIRQSLSLRTNDIIFNSSFHNIFFHSLNAALGNFVPGLTLQITRA